MMSVIFRSDDLISVFSYPAYQMMSDIFRSANSGSVLVDHITMFVMYKLSNDLKSVTCLLMSNDDICYF